MMQLHNWPTRLPLNCKRAIRMKPNQISKKRKARMKQHRLKSSIRRAKTVRKQRRPRMMANLKTQKIASLKPQRNN